MAKEKEEKQKKFEQSLNIFLSNQTKLTNFSKGEYMPPPDWGCYHFVQSKRGESFSAIWDQEQRIRRIPVIGLDYQLKKKYALGEKDQLEIFSKENLNQTNEKNEK